MRTLDRLFPASLLTPLSRYRLRIGRVIGRAITGERPTNVVSLEAASTEFREFRPYSPGDDLRHLDWNAYARLGALVLKQYEATGALTLNLIIDRSASMDYGALDNPDADGPDALGRVGHKLTHALQLAGALGVVGLFGSDTVRIVTTPTANGAVAQRVPSFAGRSNVFPLLQTLSETTAVDAPLPVATLQDRVLSPRHRNWVVIASDFEDTTEWFPLIEYLRNRRARITCLHIIAPSERKPRITGPVLVRGLEHGSRARARLEVTPRLRAAYERELARHLRRVEAFCRQKGVEYWLIDTDTPPDAGTWLSFRSRGLWA